MLKPEFDVPVCYLNTGTPDELKLRDSSAATCSASN
jgi:hypothetical protein